MFLYKNNFSSFENIWGAGPPGPHGHDATGFWHKLKGHVRYILLVAKYSPGNKVHADISDQ